MKSTVSSSEPQYVSSEFIKQFYDNLNLSCKCFIFVDVIIKNSLITTNIYTATTPIKIFFVLTCGGKKVKIFVQNNNNSNLPNNFKIKFQESFSLSVSLTENPPTFTFSVDDGKYTFIRKCKTDVLSDFWEENIKFINNLKTMKIGISFPKEMVQPNTYRKALEMVNNKSLEYGIKTKALIFFDYKKYLIRYSELIEPTKISLEELYDDIIGSFFLKIIYILRSSEGERKKSGKTEKEDFDSSNKIAFENLIVNLINNLSFYCENNDDVHLFMYLNRELHNKMNQDLENLFKLNYVNGPKGNNLIDTMEKYDICTVVPNKDLQGNSGDNAWKIQAKKISEMGDLKKQVKPFKEEMCVKTALFDDLYVVLSYPGSIDSMTKSWLEGMRKLFTDTMMAVFMRQCIMNGLSIELLRKFYVKFFEISKYFVM